MAVFIIGTSRIKTVVIQNKKTHALSMTITRKTIGKYSKETCISRLAASVVRDSANIMLKASKTNPHTNAKAK